MPYQDQTFPTLSDPTYQIQSVLGSGGGGIVYRAWHTRLQKPVVLKRITGEGRFDPRIQRIEVDILKNLRHSYLPQIYDFITERDSYGNITEVYTVMEYIPGQSLADLLRTGRRFPQQQVVHWARQLCSALVYLHSQTPPVLHSDIKPANIMLTETGDICLIDFNISLVLHEGAAQALGRSHGYASPEQYGPEALPASDQYPSHGGMTSAADVSASAQSAGWPPRSDAANGEPQFPSYGGVPPTAAGWFPRSDAANGGEPYSPQREPPTPANDATEHINAPSYDTYSPYEKTEMFFQSSPPVDSMLPLAYRNGNEENTQPLWATATGDRGTTPALRATPPREGNIQYATPPREGNVQYATPPREGSIQYAQYATQPIYGTETRRRQAIRLDARSDIYSLGATLYHLLTGEKPAISTGQIKPLARYNLGLSEGVIYFVEKSMQRDPAQRFQTAAQMAEAVNGIHMHDRRWKRQRTAHALTAALLALVIAASGAVAALGYFRMGDEKVTRYNQLVLDISEMSGKTNEDGPIGDLGELAYKEAIALFPEKVAAYSARARVLFKNGRYDECSSFIRQFLSWWTSYSYTQEDSNRLGDIYFIYAECYAEREDYANAAQYGDIALQYNQINPEYKREYAIMLARIGRIDEAETILDEMLRTQASGESLYMLRGEIAYAKTDDAAAVEWFHKALAAADSEYERQRAYLICDRAYQRLPDRIDEEIDLLMAAKRELPGQLVIIERLADACVRAARSGGSESEAYLKQAIAMFEEMRAKGNASIQTWLNIGILRQELGEYAAAREVYTDILHDYPNDYRVSLRLAYLTFEEQNDLPVEERDYAETYYWYTQSHAQYTTRPAASAPDMEMQTLETLIAELQETGWLNLIDN